MESTNSKLGSLIMQLQNRTNEAKEAFDEALAEFNREKAENDKLYQKQLGQLKEERCKWDEEKAKIEKLGASASPIVNLNVGGEKMSTTRDTLTRIEGSLLATMFIGKWEDKLQKDSDGRIFLDYDPVLFKFLLNQLRIWSNLSIKRVFRLPVGSEESFLEFLRLLEFDEKFIDPKSISAASASETVQLQSGVESFLSASSSKVQLTENNRRCENVTNTSWQCVFGKLDYSTGLHRIRLKLEKGSVNILLGICSRSKPPLNSPFYNQSTTCGWFIHGYVITNGQGSHPGWAQVKENEILELQINCDGRSLCIRNETTGAQNLMQVDINTVPFPWCLLVLLEQLGSKVSLL